MERMVNTQKLKIGMYICGLDRPWMDTPFLMQGFFIGDDKEIEDLNNYCKYVSIDIDKGIEADAYLDTRSRLTWPWPDPVRYVVRIISPGNYILRGVSPRRVWA